MSATLSRGFTLIELIVVMGVLSAVSTIGFISFSSFQNSQKFQGTVNDVANAIIVLKSRAVSQYRPPAAATICGGASISSYVFSISGSSPILYKSVAKCGGSEVPLSQGELPEGTTANAVLYTFHVINGVVDGTADTIVITDGSQTKTLTLDSGGNLSITP